MKRFLLVLFSLLLISISSSARINPEDYGNIRVDTLWWEGPIYRHYSKMVHMRITNTGETKIEGVLGINDRYGIQRGDNHVDIITTDAHLYRIYLSDERIAHHRIDANK